MAFGAEGIAGWNNMLMGMDKNRAERPYIAQNAAAQSQRLAGEADVATNQAGLLGEELKYAPEKFQLHNKLLGAQIGAHNRANQATAADKFASNPGKLFHDYQKIADQFGADSEQANMFKSMSGLGDTSPKVFGIDDQGNPVYDMGTDGGLAGGLGGKNGKGGGTQGDYGIDDQGNIYVKPTKQASSRDIRTIAGADNIRSYLGQVKDQLPKFQTFAKRMQVKAKGLLNEFAGTNYDEPSQLAEARGALMSAAEGFINTFGLNATNENVDKSMEIFTPKDGESQKGYEKRIERQLQELVKVQSRAQERQSVGVKIGNIYGDKSTQGSQGSPQQAPSNVPPPAPPQNGAPNPQQQQQLQQRMQQVQAMAQAAIKNGADPRVVEQRMKQMMGGG